MLLFLLLPLSAHAGIFDALRPGRAAEAPYGAKDDTDTLAALPEKLAEGVVVQTWLSRTPFQPGSIDGHAGGNVAHALRAFQKAEGLRVTGRVDRATAKALRRAADADDRPVLRRQELTAADVSGPYAPLPEGLYDAHTLECMCYRSSWEQVAERYQVAPGLLATLNPGVDLDTLQAGDTVIVPDPTPVHGLDTDVATIRIDVDDKTLTALDAKGNVLRQYPTVVGEKFAAYRGAMEVANIAMDPDYDLDPKTWEEIPDTMPEVRIPPGPNSPVGTVWMGLSKEGYGIHGTSDPELVGHTESHGCVRLTNWSAEELAAYVVPGKTKVDFVGLGRG